MARHDNTFISPTFMEYWQNLLQKSAGKERDLSNHRKNLLLMKDFISSSACIHYLLDMHTGKYVYVSENVNTILGYDAKEFYDKGLAFTIKQTHKDDFEQYSRKLFKKIYQFYSFLNPEDFKTFRYSYNTRIRRSDGAYAHILQQINTLECDENGIPSLVYGIASDISAYKTDSKITLSIAGFEEESGFMEVQYDFFPETKTSLISKRENEVLQLLMLGGNSKYIAEKLFISEHTVNVHRKNMLEKTKSRNTAELVRVAVSLGIV